MLVPLLGVLVVLAMGFAAVVTVLGIQERDKREAKERELHLAVAENNDLKARLEDTLKEKSRFEEQLARAREELATSQEELLKTVEAQETLTRSVEDREREIGRLTKDLEQARNESKRIATQFSELQTERDAVTQQLAELERAKSELESKLMEFSHQPTVELEKVFVTNASNRVSEGGAVMPVSAAVNTPSTGQVVVVNREYDFIVMNLGKNQGLSVGQEFQIVRGNEVLGRVRVEKVYDELSAAAILPESKKENIKEGDAVRAL
jgi:flagellar biosynthesis chaperone FliJ